MRVRRDVAELTTPLQTASNPMRVAKGIVGGGENQKWRLTVLTEGIVRIEWAPDSDFEDRPSSFAYLREDVKSPDFELKDEDDHVEIKTNRFRLKYDKKEFTKDGLMADVFGFDTWHWGDSEDQNLKGTYRTLDLVDGKRHRETGQDIVLEPGIMSRRGSTLLDDSKSMLFDGDFVASRKEGDDRKDCYLFAYGHDYREALKDFYKISGPTPLLPRFALGNWWSRYFEYTTESYLELMDTFKSHGIPLSVAVIDMDWHLVNSKEVKDAGRSGWTGYTWNKELFPDPKGFLDELHKRDLQTSLNDHPADGVAPYEDMFKEVAEFMGEDPEKSSGVPFDSTSKQYLKAYFDIVLKKREDEGVDFWWIDWQQGNTSKLKNVDPLWVLNHFHHLHSLKRGNLDAPLLFSRFGGPGSHRYPVGFSGDTVTTWASLRFQPEFTATASNIGYGWWSHDIGGHQFGVRDDELMVRWVQLGVLSPVMRLHSTKNRWVTKEPWKIPGLAGEVIMDWMRLRHMLIPYLYSMNLKASEEGTPIVQPLYWDYDVDEAYDFKNQFFFGSELLVIPITEPQDPESRLGKVEGWLPPGTWVDYFSYLKYTGGRKLSLSRPLGQLPVFFKAGAIVAFDANTKPTNSTDNPEGFSIVVCAGENGKTEIIENSGTNSKSESKNKFRRWPLSWSEESTTLEIGPASEDNASSSRTWEICLITSSPTQNVTLIIDGATSHPPFKTTHNRTQLSIGSISISQSARIVFDFSDEPPLKNDVTSAVETVIRDAQIEYATKDAIGRILDDAGLSVARKIGELLRLDVNESLRGYLIECLTAEE